MEKLKVAVIGCGNIAPVHIGAIQSLENAELYAVCDIDRDRANAFAEKYGAKAVYDYEKVLGDPEVDVVHICTPHWLHEPMAIAAADTGKNVFLEKPAGLSTEEIKNIAGAVFESETEGLKECFVAEFLNEFYKIYKDLSTASFMSEYREKCFFLGEEITVIQSETKRKATAISVDENARLEVEYENGEREFLGSGEISIKI